MNEEDKRQIWETEHLIFSFDYAKPKTAVYNVIAKCGGAVLGQIKWYPAWRHYCFFPTTEFETVHSDRCLASISLFVEFLNKKHKGIIKVLFEEFWECVSPDKDWKLKELEKVYLKSDSEAGK